MYVLLPNNLLTIVTTKHGNPAFHEQISLISNKQKVQILTTFTKLENIQICFQALQFGKNISAEHWLNNSHVCSRPDTICSLQFLNQGSNKACYHLSQQVIPIH